MMPVMSEPTGVLILHKGEGMTSHDCVNRIRRLFGTKKVGHTGTLDPMATGVLPILLGRAAKAADFLAAEDKIYRAGLKLGLTTDTEDTTGQILSRSDAIPDEASVRTVCARFVGEIMQVPPMYSALKVGGQKLVDLARQGITVERQARPITVRSLEVAPGGSPEDYILTVHCSKGTYIRTLCADIGGALGCGGAMSSLARLKSGAFSLEGSVTLEQLEAMDTEARLTLLRPIESLFADLEAVHPVPFFEKLSRSGCVLYQKKLGTAYPIGTRLRMIGADGFYALGEVVEDEGGSAVKTLKLFVL